MLASSRWLRQRCDPSQHAQYQGSPSSVSAISSVRRCNWPRGSVPVRSPNQILVSDVVADLCLGKDLPFKDLGDVF